MITIMYALLMTINPELPKALFFGTFIIDVCLIFVIGSLIEGAKDNIHKVS